MRGCLPYDVVLEIAGYLSPHAILNMSLASRHLHDMLTSSLYRTITLHSSRDCKVILELLLKRKDICGYIRELTVQPNNYQAWPKPDKRICEIWITNAIKKISPSLISMHSFDWDGLELPDDSLWVALQSNCLKLKSISASIGIQPLYPESALFNFSGLVSFSFIVRHGVDGTRRYSVFEQLPRQLWDMILKRCPDLQKLAICSFSPLGRALDFERIIEGHWPRLNSLLFGPFGYQPKLLLGPLSLSMTDSFGRFLSKHNELNYLQLLWDFKFWPSPKNIRTKLSPSALPVLDTFIGTYHQLAELPHPATLRKIDISCEPVRSEPRLDNVNQILGRFINLTTLNISLGAVGLSSKTAHSFFVVLSTFNKLTDLFLMCSIELPLRPTLEVLTRELSLLLPLKRFTFVKRYRYTEFPDAMLKTALRIAKQVQRLDRIDIRWERSTVQRVVQKGTYSVVSGSDGLPEALMAVEQGIPLVGDPFSRRYQYNIAW